MAGRSSDQPVVAGDLDLGQADRVRDPAHHAGHLRREPGAEQDQVGAQFLGGAVAPVGQLEHDLVAVVAGGGDVVHGDHPEPGPAG